MVVLGSPKPEQPPGLDRPEGHAGVDFADWNFQLVHRLAGGPRLGATGVIELALRADILGMERIGIGLIGIRGAVADHDHMTADFCNGSTQAGRPPWATTFGAERKQKSEKRATVQTACRTAHTQATSRKPPIKTSMGHLLDKVCRSSLLDRYKVATEFGNDARNSRNAVGGRRLSRAEVPQPRDRCNSNVDGPRNTVFGCACTPPRDIWSRPAGCGTGGNRPGARRARWRGGPRHDNFRMTSIAVPDDR